MNKHIYESKIYGVLKAQVSIDHGPHFSHNSHHTHYDLLTIGQGDDAYQVNLNIQSDPSRPNVRLYKMDGALPPSFLQALGALPKGFTPLPSQPNTLALDYLRMPFIPKEALATTPPANAASISSLLDPYLAGHQHVVVFGTAYGTLPHPLQEDHYGTRRHLQEGKPAKGIDDIHMNQGLAGKYAYMNGTYQDGALFVCNPAGEYTSFYFAFADGQSFHTDDQGNPIAA